VKCHNHGETKPSSIGMSHPNQKMSQADDAIYIISRRPFLLGGPAGKAIVLHDLTQN
jgi:hypothetical protein